MGAGRGKSRRARIQFEITEDPGPGLYTVVALVGDAEWFEDFEGSASKAPGFELAKSPDGEHVEFFVRAQSAQHAQTQFLRTCDLAETSAENLEVIFVEKSDDVPDPPNTQLEADKVMF